MAKTKTAKTKKAAKRTTVIEGVVRHTPCGWVSSGKAFVEGAGCPRCGERLFAGDVEEVTEGQLVDDDDGEDDDDDEDDEEEDDDDAAAAEEEDEDLEDEEDDEDLDDEEDEPEEDE